MYSLQGFQWKKRAYEFFPEGHPQRWEITLILRENFTYSILKKLKRKTNLVQLLDVG